MKKQTDIKKMKKVSACCKVSTWKCFSCGGPCCDACHMHCRLIDNNKSQNESRKNSSRSSL